MKYPIGTKVKIVNSCNCNGCEGIICDIVQVGKISEPLIYSPSCPCANGDGEVGVTWNQVKLCIRVGEQLEFGFMK
jgi:hypothetical protein